MSYSYASVEQFKQIRNYYLPISGAGRLTD